MPPVAILAGGLATRLYPLTERMPKALIQVAGEPFIAHQLRLLRREGIIHVVLCLGFLGEMVRDVVGRRRTVRPETSPIVSMATSCSAQEGRSSRLCRCSRDSSCSYGDSYLDIAYGPARGIPASGAPALMTVFRNEGHWDTSNVLFDGTLSSATISDTQAMTCVILTMGLDFHARCELAEWPGDAFDLADVYAQLAGRADLRAMRSSHRFYEIGTPKALPRRTPIYGGADERQRLHQNLLSRRSPR